MNKKSIVWFLKDREFALDSLEEKIIESLNFEFLHDFKIIYLDSLNIGLCNKNGLYIMDSQGKKLDIPKVIFYL